MKPDVTICIPTYQSKTFIDRTLRCARAQTHEAIRIVVSVDLSDDGTIEVCRSHAREDSRITIMQQKERLGWSQNANAALDYADTEFFTLYFHDDIIEPTYIEKLYRALSDRGDAISAHCDLVEFGLMEEIKPAHEYIGSAIRRMIDCLMTARGTILRSMVRNAPGSGSIRFPKLHGDSHWSAGVFGLRLLSAGNALAVHEPLYHRWQREGSLTRSKGWHPENIDSVLTTMREAYPLCRLIIERAAKTTEERIIGLYSLKLFQLLFLKRYQLLLKEFEINHDILIQDIPPSEELRLIPGVLDREAEQWILDTEEKLKQMDLKLARARSAHAGSTQ